MAPHLWYRSCASLSAYRRLAVDCKLIASLPWPCRVAAAERMRKEGRQQEAAQDTVVYRAVVDSGAGWAAIDAAAAELAAAMQQL